MIYAIIENGKVTNVCEGSAEWAASVGAVEITNGGIGWSYDGSTFTEPPVDVQALQDAIQSQIDRLERDALLPRITREVFLVQMVETAAGMSIDEPTLYAVNIGYQKLKDFDDSITALRTEMNAL